MPYYRKRRCYVTKGWCAAEFCFCGVDPEARCTEWYDVAPEGSPGELDLFDERFLAFLGATDVCTHWNMEQVMILNANLKEWACSCECIAAR